jgi:hypothetical protein
MTSAAAARRRLGEIGRDIASQEGPPAGRRATALRLSLSGSARPAIPLAALIALPDWLRLPRQAQAKLARDAALASISASLARSIDGSWLGAHAARAGEAAVQRAIDADPAAAERRALPPIDADGLEPRGFALLAALLPDDARPLLDWTPREGATPPRDRAEACVAAALQGAA